MSFYLINFFSSHRKPVNRLHWWSVSKLQRQFCTLIKALLNVNKQVLYIVGNLPLLTAWHCIIWFLRTNYSVKNCGSACMYALAEATSILMAPTPDLMFRGALNNEKIVCFVFQLLPKLNILSFVVTYRLHFYNSFLPLLTPASQWSRAFKTLITLLSGEIFKSIMSSRHNKKRVQLTEDLTHLHLNDGPRGETLWKNATGISRSGGVGMGFKNKTGS